MSKKQIREKFRNDVFTRDKHTCLVCNKKRTEEELDAHHITDRNQMPNGGYVKENGITVCKEVCHMKVEAYHLSGGVSWVEGLSPNHLYDMIKSSKEIAIKKSEQL